MRDLWRRSKLYEPGPADLFDIRVELENAVPYDIPGGITSKANPHIWQKGVIHRRSYSAELTKLLGKVLDRYPSHQIAVDIRAVLADVTFTDGVEKPGPILWYGSHWNPALTLCNAFARIAAFAESDRVRFSILKHRKQEKVALVTYLFSDHGTMRRLLSVAQPDGKPHTTVSDHNYFAPHEVI